MKRWSLIAVCLLVGGVIGTAVTTSWLQGQNPVAAVPVLPKELASYRDVVKTVLPAVVSIEARQSAKVKQIQQRIPQLDDQLLPEEFRRFFNQQDRNPAVPETPSPSGFGSGFLVDPKGMVLTNFHVVDGADQVEVQLRDGRKFISKDIKVDPKTDLALIKIEAKDALPYLAFGDSTTMEIGDRVLAVGAPFGLTGTVTAGIVSAKGRSLNVNLYEDFVQTDAAINPGNSGGPLVNLEGKVIGINSAIKSRSGGFQGVGMAISADLAKNVMDQLLKNGVVHRGYLGVQVKDIDTPELAAKLGLKDQHGVVTQVFKDSPAAKAGVQDGDVISSLNGHVVKNGKDLQAAVVRLEVGKPVDMNVLHDGQAKMLKVVIEEQPQSFGTAKVTLPRGSKTEKGSVLDKVGVEVNDLTPELAEKFGFPAATKGVLVMDVQRDGLGALAGLRKGMVIAKVDRQPVTSAAKLKEMVEAASLKDGLLMQVQSPQGGTSYLVLKTA